MIEDAKQALDLVRRRKIVTLTAVPGLPSLVDEVAGGPVRGSWWAHPKGSVIYAITNVLHDAPDVLMVKLVEGKVSFVDGSLWAPLYRIVTDARWRSDVSRDLGPCARKLLDAIEERSELRLDEVASAIGHDRSQVSKAKDEVEKRLLALSDQVHTASGKHATVFRAWETWAGPATKRVAARLSMEGALAELHRHGGGARLGVDRPCAPSRSKPKRT